MLNHRSLKFGPYITSIASKLNAHNVIAGRSDIRTELQDPVVNRSLAAILWGLKFNSVRPEINQTFQTLPK